MVHQRQINNIPSHVTDLLLMNLIKKESLRSKDQQRFTNLYKKGTIKICKIAKTLNFPTSVEHQKTLCKGQGQRSVLDARDIQAQAALN